MFIFALLFSALSVKTISEQTWSLFIGKDTPFFVRFYSPDCPHCRMMQDDFEQTEKRFDGVGFGEVNCLKNAQMCVDFGVETYPVVQLFLPGKLEGIPFTEEKTMPEFIKFIEDHTGIKSKRLPTYLTDVTATNFGSFVSGGQCSFVAFYDLASDLVPVLKYMRRVAESFVMEPNVSVGAVNCRNNVALCETEDIAGTPVFKLNRANEWLVYDLDLHPEAMVEYLNEQCGTQRELGGLLKGSVGTVEKADALLGEFREPSKRSEILAKMKEIPGAELYVKFMQSVIEKGEEQVRKDAAKLWAAIGQRKVSWKLLDQMKQRYNVLMKIVPTPKPRPVDDAEL